MYMHIRPLEIVIWAGLLHVCEVLRWNHHIIYKKLYHVCIYRIYRIPDRSSCCVHVLLFSKPA